MKSKLITTIGSASLLLGMFAIQGCFESNYPDYGYGYGGGRAYYAEPAPVIVGDYDEHHAWHNRDWWVSNRSDWVSDHHKDWLGHSDDRSRDVHASADHDHDRH